MQQSINEQNDTFSGFAEFWSFQEFSRKRKSFQDVRARVRQQG